MQQLQDIFGDPLNWGVACLIAAAFYVATRLLQRMPPFKHVDDVDGKKSRRVGLLAWVGIVVLFGSGTAVAVVVTGPAEKVETEPKTLLVCEDGVCKAAEEDD